MSDAPAVLPLSHDRAPFRLGYRPWLDGIRGIAVLLVLACHYDLATGGFLGLDLFFVLSGFLITSLLVEEWQSSGRIRLGQFYLRRVLRLVPALFTMLAGCLVYVVVFWPEHLATYVPAMIVAACYLTNCPFLHSYAGSELGLTWSLSVEEQFYLIWPLLLLTMLKLRMSRLGVAGVVIAGIGASATLRALLWTKDGDLTLAVRLYTSLDTRADALLVGCLLGLAAAWNWLPHSQRAGRVYRVLAGLSLAGLGYLLIFKPQFATHHLRGTFTLVAVMMAALVAKLLVVPSRWELWVLEWKPLVFTGKISYGLYLYHYPVLIYLNLPRGWQHPGSLALNVTITTALALASWYLIEQPFLRLKKRLHAAPERAAPPSGRMAA